MKFQNNKGPQTLIKSLNKSTISTSNAELICDVCHKTFDKEKNLKRHKKLHNNTKEYVCPEPSCCKSYARSDHLNRHMISHSANSKPFKCELCVQRFSNKSHLKRHTKLHLTSDQANSTNRYNKYECRVCDEVFTHKRHLRTHEEMKHAIKRIQSKKKICFFPYCESKFETEERLQTHINCKHNKIQDLGKLGVSSKKTISQMIKKYEPIVSNTHLHKKVHICPVDNCLKAYTSRYNLKVHIDSYHNNKAEFICHLCNTFFKHKCTLRKHLLSHRNESHSESEKIISERINDNDVNMNYMSISDHQFTNGVGDCREFQEIDTRNDIRENYMQIQCNEFTHELMMA